MGQRSPGPTLWGPSSSPGATTREATAIRSPHTTPRESPHTATKTQHSPKIMNEWTHFFKKGVLLCKIAPGLGQWCCSRVVTPGLAPTPQVLRAIPQPPSHPQCDRTWPAQGDSWGHTWPVVVHLTCGPDSADRYPAAGKTTSGCVCEGLWKRSADGIRTTHLSKGGPASALRAQVDQKGIRELVLCRSWDGTFSHPWSAELLVLRPLSDSTEPTTHSAPAWAMAGSRERSVSTRTTASSCKRLLCCLSLSTIHLRLVCFSEEPWWVQDSRKFFSDSSQFEVLSLPLQDSLVTQLVKNLPAMQETQVGLLSQEIPWRRAWQPTPVFLPGKSHGWRSLVIYSP